MPHLRSCAHSVCVSMHKACHSTLAPPALALPLPPQPLLLLLQCRLLLLPLHPSGSPVMQQAGAWKW